MDLQIHTTMHVPYPFFSKGLKYFNEKRPPALSYKHQFKNVNYANYLQANKGARIIANGALNIEYISNPKKARKGILKQINYVNRFAEKNAAHFVVANNPDEVRHYIHHSDKTVIIHCIEGGKELIKSQADADFWASKGVAFITLIHLVDCEYGGAAILPGLITRLINLRAPRKTENEMGLTEHGKKAIVWLANAGIMTDITHMNDRTRKDVLQLMEEHHIPPLSTHDGFKPIQNHPRALDEEDIVNVYKNNGFISLPISGFSCMPHNAHEKYQKAIDSLELYCAGSVDSYMFTYTEVKKFIENNATLGYRNNMSEAEKVNYCIGWQSDFNGWLNHSRPRVGNNGCFPFEENNQYEDIETVGMPHPGLLTSQWKYLEKNGVDTAPIKRASEKFLQQWQYFLNNKGKF